MADADALNKFPDFPYRVDPFPQDWLRQFAKFDPLAASDKDGKAPDEFHFED